MNIYNFLFEAIKDKLPDYMQKALRNVGEFERIKNMDEPQYKMRDYVQMGAHPFDKETFIKSVLNKKVSVKIEKTQEDFIKEVKEFLFKRYNEIKQIKIESADAQTKVLFNVFVTEVRTLLYFVFNISKHQKASKFIPPINKNILKLLIEGTTKTLLDTLAKLSKTPNKHSFLFNQGTASIENAIDFLITIIKALDIDGISGNPELYAQYVKDLVQNWFGSTQFQKSSVNDFLSKDIKLYISDELDDRLRMAVFRETLSCQNLYSGEHRRCLPANLIDDYMAVAYIISVGEADDTEGNKHPFKTWARCLLRLSIDGKSIIVHNVYGSGEYDKAALHKVFVKEVQKYSKLPVLSGGAISIKYPFDEPEIKPYLDNIPEVGMGNQGNEDYHTQIKRNPYKLRGRIPLGINDNYKLFRRVMKSGEFIETYGGFKIDDYEIQPFVYKQITLLISYQQEEHIKLNAYDRQRERSYHLRFSVNGQERNEITIIGQTEVTEYVDYSQYRNTVNEKSLKINSTEPHDLVSKINQFIKNYIDDFWKKYKSYYFKNV